MEKKRERKGIPIVEAPKPEAPKPEVPARATVDVYLVRDGAGKHHLSKSTAPSKGEALCGTNELLARRVLFRRSDGGRMPDICRACTRAELRAWIVESPPKKPRKAKWKPRKAK